MILQIFRAYKWLCNRWPINAKRVKRVYADDAAAGLCHFFVVPDKLMKCLSPDAIAGSVDRENQLQNSVGADGLRQRGKSKSYTFYARHIFSMTLVQSFSIKVVIFIYAFLFIARA